MPTLPTNVRLAYEPKTTPGTLYYECRQCGRKTKTYRKITRHLRGCAKNSRLGAPSSRG
jgi:ribosomal protein S14